MLTVGEFRAQFGEESQCAEQLTRQRWPEGFRCPRCAGTTRGYIAARRVHECKQCAYQCSVTAGTIFHKTRTPLTSWFWAIYRMSHDKKGISAVQLMKEIGVSYVTAWTMQHKIRKAMEDRDRRYKLHGIIEIDEGYVGGAESGEGRQGRRPAIGIGGSLAAPPLPHHRTCGSASGGSVRLSYFAHSLGSPSKSKWAFGNAYFIAGLLAIRHGP